MRSSRGAFSAAPTGMPRRDGWDPRKRGIGWELSGHRKPGAGILADGDRNVTSRAMCDCGPGLATGDPMDQRIKSFLTKVLVLAGEDTNAVRDGVRDTLADCETIFRAQEPNKHMRDMPRNRSSESKLKEKIL
jgi:hypothetical protein